MLKPALSRGEFQCIGATTTDEFRKTIEKDGALDRRFQKVIIEPTSKEETLQILNNLKDRYEEHHNITYTPEALEACVRLTDRYVTERSSLTRLSMPWTRQEAAYISRKFPFRRR